MACGICDSFTDDVIHAGHLCLRCAYHATPINQSPCVLCLEDGQCYWQDRSLVKPIKPLW